MNSTVSVAKCVSYDAEEIARLLRYQLGQLRIGPEFFSGKRVAIKPNFVSAKSPDAAATTHPAVISAVYQVISEMNPSRVILAESPGGPLTEAALKLTYRQCQADRVSEETGLQLNYNTKAVTIKYPAGKVCREFHILEEIAESDIVIDLCKLKTHSLTKMSCATKNFFGVVPGIEKFEMHSRFPDIDSFTDMIVDLASLLCSSKKILAICDAVWGMEGNGPTNGKRRDIGALLVSESPFALDIVAEHILGFDGSVLMCQCIAKSGLAPADYRNIKVVGDDLSSVCIGDIQIPDAHSGWFLKNLSGIFGGKLARYFQPKPVVNRLKCVGCSRCFQSCPEKTIEMLEKDGKKYAHILKAKCIHCFCCQELCPFNAIDIKKNLLIKFVH